MLILGRKEGDSIIIDGNIRIVVVSCERGGVRIGIDAPDSIKILRGEIADQVTNENKKAAVPDYSTWAKSLGVPDSANHTTATATPDTTEACTASLHEDGN